MILYSIMPPEIVFQGIGNTDGTKYLEAEYMGVKILVSQMSDKSYSIARILSTRPELFLEPALQPGMAVDSSKLKIVE